MIVLLSRKHDLHTDAVISSLNKLGADYVRLNTDQFVDTEVSFGPDGGDIRLPDGTTIRTSDIRSVWGRRTSPSQVWEHVDMRYQKFSESQWVSFSDNLWALLSDRQWLNHPIAVECAKKKIVQLAAAKEVGFVIPKTVFTNTLASARKLLRSVSSSEIIYKPVGHGVLEEERKIIVFTSAIGESDIVSSKEGGIRVAPGIFQEYIPKHYEVRTTVVGDRVFAARIDSQQSERTKTDWRRYDFANVEHRIEQLPAAISDACVQLVKRLGLRYGAMDLIVTPTGEWVFLENNCNGQWLWLEELVGLKISDAVARLLIELATK